MPDMKAKKTIYFWKQMGRFPISSPPTMRSQRHAGIEMTQDKWKTWTMIGNLMPIPVKMAGN